MSINKTKVAIVGCGAVGSTLAYNLASNHICDKLALIDKFETKSWAEMTDINHSLGFSDYSVNVASGDYSLCSDADIVVISVAAPYKDGMTRLDMYENARVMMDEIIPAVVSSGFSGIFLVVTNPVDLITAYVQKISGFAPERVFGTGTSLDSSRLRMYLANLLGVDSRSVNAICMGEHGDSQMVPWSQVTIGGKRFFDILEDNPERLAKVDTDNIIKEISTVAYDVVRHKRATTYGIASVTSAIIRAILFDENKVMPVSCMLHNEYGFDGIYAGVPAVLYSGGIKERVTFHLTEEEQQKLFESISKLSSYIR